MIRKERVLAAHRRVWEVQEGSVSGVKLVVGLDIVAVCSGMEEEEFVVDLEVWGVAAGVVVDVWM